MATVLIIETYQVIADDAGSITVLSPECRTRERAERALAVMADAVASGVVVVAGALLVRSTPGNQQLAVTEPATGATLRSDLADRVAQVVLYARVNDGSVSHVRIGSAPAGAILKLEP